MNSRTINLDDLTTEQRVQLYELVDQFHAENAKPKVWRPMSDDLGWLICEDGGISKALNLEYDLDAFAQGNVFQTRELAEMEVNRRAALQEMLLWAAENVPYEAVWDGVKKNWTLTYNPLSKRWGKFGSVPGEYEFHLPKFASKDDAERFIEAQAANLEIYRTGIK